MGPKSPVQEEGGNLLIVRPNQVWRQTVRELLHGQAPTINRQ